MTGKQLYFKKKCPWPFGDFVQAHDDKNITNQIIDQTQGEVYLGPTGKLQVNHDFMLPRTGSKITYTHFTELPTPPRVTR